MQWPNESSSSMSSGSVHLSRVASWDQINDCTEIIHFARLKNNLLVYQVGVAKLGESWSQLSSHSYQPSSNRKIKYNAGNPEQKDCNSNNNENPGWSCQNDNYRTTEDSSNQRGWTGVGINANIEYFMQLGKIEITWLELWWWNR